MRYSLVAMTILCSACSTLRKLFPPGVDRPPAATEIVIPGVDKKQVKDAIVNRAMNAGLKVGKIEDYRATFHGQVESLAYDFGTAEEIVEYDFVELGSGVRIDCHIGVLQPVRGFSDITDSHRDLCSSALNAIRDSLATSAQQPKALQ